MRHVTAIAVSVLLSCLALAGTGGAQTLQPVQVQGTLQSADCQSGQVTLATAGGNDTFQATGQTVAYVNGSTVSLCSLQTYAGDSATAVLVPMGNALDLSQISVTAQAAPSTSGSIFSSPIAIGLGAALLGGLIGYVMGHQNQPAQTPAYTPYGYGNNTPYGYGNNTPYGYGNSTPYGYPTPYGYSGPGYYPAGYAPAYLPAGYPYNRAYYYQGHRYYHCASGAWSVDQGCQPGQ